MSLTWQAELAESVSRSLLAHCGQPERMALIHAEQAKRRKAAVTLAAISVALLSAGLVVLWADKLGMPEWWR